jgi:hypothetical protein
MISEYTAPSTGEMAELLLSSLMEHAVHAKIFGGVGVRWREKFAISIF